MREAAATFAAGPGDIACLQAPLRIRNSGDFIPAQFANEYAALFEVTLPAMARLGLPFPFGGTSNHLRVDALCAVGGWDAWNVTEDAELGFRLARHGWKSDVLSTPTYENAPRDVHTWLPQRTRWLKGYLETLVVTFGVSGFRPKLLFAACMTLGLALGASLVHLPAFTWLAVYASFALLGGPGPSLTSLDVMALVCGWGAAIGINAYGARRAGLPVRLRDALLAPFYWPLLTFAALQAIWRWAWEPERWDKTEHTPWTATDQ